MHENLNDIKLSSSWLTVNGNCNFSCPWCYAEGLAHISNDMGLDLAVSLLDLISELNINNVILIGGEPTIWKHLIYIVKYARKKNIEPILVTNGLAFESSSFCRLIKDAGINGISLSIKGGNESQYINLTGGNFFRRVMHGIDNIKMHEIDLEISINVNSMVLKNIVELTKVASGHGKNRVVFQYCQPTFNGEAVRSEYMPEQSEIVNEFIGSYDEINDITGGKFILEQSLPCCLWPSEFIGKLESRNQILYTCHVFRRKGVIFGQGGEILACNHLHNIPLGTYGKDFSDKVTFLKFWQHPSLADFYDRLVAYPSQQCDGCVNYNKCGGGCPLQWFVRDPNILIPGIKE